MNPFSTSARSAGISREIDRLVRGNHHARINSVLLWQCGELVSENTYNGFTPESRNVMRSVAKSIVSLAIGIACGQGRIASLDTPVASFLPEFAQNRNWKHRRITIRHLLTMTSGIFWNGGVHYHCPMMDQMKQSGNWVDYIADCNVKDTPGTKYNYKEWDMILATRVLHAVSGDAYDFIENELYGPLGIKSGRWYQSRCGTYYSVALDEEGETPSNLTGKEMLKIGILALQHGTWNSRQIVPPDYIREMLAPSPQNKNYGFFWWLGDDWYGCRGYGGQSITVFPGEEAVVVTQATPTPRGMMYDDVIFGCRRLLTDGY